MNKKVFLLGTVSFFIVFFAFAQNTADSTKTRPISQPFQPFVIVRKAIAVSAKLKGNNYQPAPKEKPIDQVIGDFGPAPEADFSSPDDLPPNVDTQQTYATRVPDKDMGAYFQVSEAVREKREYYLKRSYQWAQKTLFDYFKTEQAGVFEYYAGVIKEHQTFLKGILLDRSDVQQDEKRFNAYFRANSELKEAMTYVGLFRLYRYYGASDVKNAQLHTAQQIELGMHLITKGKIFSALRDNYGLTTSLDFAAGYQAKGTEFPNIFLLRRSLDELWEFRHEWLPDVSLAVDEKLTAAIQEAVPYNRVYVDVFKAGAFGEGSPEFVAIWKNSDSQTNYRRELVSLGLVTTGVVTNQRWHPILTKGVPGNTPDGVWKIMGFDKHFIGEQGKKGGNFDMRGMIMLNYGNGISFLGRGFHHVFFGSPWGSCHSHGCIRVFTDPDTQTGFANVLWATINPTQLNNVDWMDYGDDGDVNRFSESAFNREIVRTMRERVWITVYSKFMDGFQFQGPTATYSESIRKQYINYQTYTHLNIETAAKQLLRKNYLTTNPEDPTEKRRGQYWVYNLKAREEIFKIDLKK